VVLKVNIPVSFSKVRKIIHIADTHIRLYKRYTEYQQTLERMINMLMESDLTDSIIVHCGDVVHSKTDMSPEMINLTSWWLSNLANLAPTLIIAGNHDLNVANPNRLDALSPIVRMVNHTQLHYLKHSGIYTCADVDFAVLSIIGDKLDWPKAEDCTASTKIALFHGPVFNATTDVGYTVTNRHVMVETFNGYDIALLGDIHRHQVLQERAPIIVYPGSTVQQNHGETPKGHGWCEWEVDTRSFTFVELPNEYGYYTLRMENDIIPSIDDMPQNVRLRMFVGNMDPSEIKKLLATIRVTHNITEVSVNKFSGLLKHRSKSVIGNILDIHDVGFQNKLITDYLHERAKDITPELIDAVCDLNTTLNTEIVTDDPTRKLVWTPISLRFDNLFTYGTGNYINFKDLNGLVGLFSPNATGKSSIPDAICFALYDRTPRTNKASNIMNSQENDCYCEFMFEIAGIQYVVERKGKKNKNNEVKVDVDFYQLNLDGTRISLNGEQRRDTNVVIRNYVGEFDDFILTALSSQGNNSIFIDRGQADRKDLMSQFMGLTIFDKLHYLADEKSKEVSFTLKRFAQDDFTQNLVNLRETLKTKRTEYDGLMQGSTELATTIDDYEHRIRECIAKKLPIPVFKGTLGDLTNKAAQFERILLELGPTVDKKVEELTTINKQLELANTKLTTEYATIEDDNIKYKAVVGKFQTASNELQLLNAAIARYEGDMDRLATHKFNSSCQYCVNNSFVQNAIKSMELWNDAIQKRLTLENTVRDLQHEVDQLKEIPDKYVRYTSGVKYVQQKEQERAQLTIDHSRLATKIAGCKTDLKDAQAAVQEFVNAQDAIFHNQGIDLEIREFESHIHVVRSDKMVIDKNIQKLYGEILLLESDKNKMLNRIQEAEKLEQQFEAYRYYLSVVSRDGLPYKLIAEVLPSVEFEVNNLLSQMVEFSVALEMDGKNISGKIIYDETRTWPLELASGMEKFISGLAIRVALMKISSLPKSNFLILDEGLGTLDQENLASISALFDILKTQFTWILLISHVDTARDLADYLMSIERSNGYSKIYEK
jgi:DNA repair exonuclease SbcCD ATPase subunit/DNA repair exonuclease SbcCD nuclease subunit